VAALAVASSAHAQVQLTVSDDFTQTRAQNQWAYFSDGACLTAGDGTRSIPACIGPALLPGPDAGGRHQRSSADQGGSGALRLTNGFTKGQTSGFNFGFKTRPAASFEFHVRGRHGCADSLQDTDLRGTPAATAAVPGVDETRWRRRDELLLIDATNKAAPYDMGAFGGSLGYTCSTETTTRARRAEVRRVSSTVCWRATWASHR